MKYELRHGIYEREQNITLDKWFHIWIEEYKKPTVKLTTYELYLRTYEQHIKPHFKGREIKDIKAENIEELGQTLVREGNYERLKKRYL